jgi:Tfp pilus assembly protein PilF
LAAAPDSALAHNAKAQVLRAQSRCKEAIPEYETALAFDSSRARPMPHIGWCKFLTGSIHEAIPYFEHAIRLSPYGPGIAPWYDRIGVIQQLEGHTEEAIASLEKAKSGSPRLPFVRAHLAAAYALAGQTRRAQTELAAARAPDSIYTSLASVMKSRCYDNPKIRALAEATYFAGPAQGRIAER